MSKPRNVELVIEKLLPFIPSTEEKLINELVYYRDSLWNQPPEVLDSKYAWAPLISILMTNIPVVDCDWKEKLSNIVKYDNENIGCRETP